MNFKVISEGLTVGYLDSRIVYFHIPFSMTSRERVDVWYEAVEQAILSVPATQFIRFFDRNFDNDNRKKSLFYTCEEALNWANKSIIAFGVSNESSN
jgi:hypothetical protein